MIPTHIHIPRRTHINTHHSRLQHDSVASSQTGGHLPRQHHQGIVPGHDDATHTNGLPLGEGEVLAGPGVVDGDGLAVDLVTPAGKISGK